MTGGDGQGCKAIKFINVAGSFINSGELAAGDKLAAMNGTKIKSVSARILLTLGVIAMVVGCLDPLEGSVVILAGSGLVALGTWLGQRGRGLVLYRLCLFGLVAFGVMAMFVLGAMGGFGGKSGLSGWWGLLLLPYPIGWLLGMANLIARGIERVLHHRAA